MSVSDSAPLRRPEGFRGPTVKKRFGARNLPLVKSFFDMLEGPLPGGVELDRLLARGGKLLGSKLSEQEKVNFMVMLVEECPSVFRKVVGAADPATGRTRRGFDLRALDSANVGFTDVCFADGFLKRDAVASRRGEWFDMCACGRVYDIKCMIALGFPPRTRDERGGNCMHRLALRPDVLGELLCILVGRCGMSMNTGGYNGMTVFHEWAAVCPDELVAWLTDPGLRYMIGTLKRDRGGRSVFDTLAAFNPKAFLKLARDNIDRIEMNLPRQAPSGGPPLHAAVKRLGTDAAGLIGHMVERLDAIPTLRDGKRRTLLHTLAGAALDKTGESSERLRYMIALMIERYEIDPNATDLRGETFVRTLSRVNPEFLSDPLLVEQMFELGVDFSGVRRTKSANAHLAQALNAIWDRLRPDVTAPATPGFLRFAADLRRMKLTRLLKERLSDLRQVERADRRRAADDPVVRIQPDIS